jgi:hypothetical protein
MFYYLRQNSAKRSKLGPMQPKSRGSFLGLALFSGGVEHKLSFERIDRNDDVVDLSAVDCCVHRCCNGIAIC